MNRREFLAASTAIAASVALPAIAQPDVFTLMTEAWHSARHAAMAARSTTASHAGPPRMYSVG